MPTLSSLLVQRGDASMRSVEAAIARQVLQGGDLGTNLLELGTVAEDTLSAVLAEAHGLEAVAVGPLPPPDPALLRLVPGELAARQGIFPVSLEGRSLVVATSEPLTTAVADDLGFALGVGVRQLVAPLVRVRQAIARHYGLPLERRLERLVAKLDGRADPSPSSLPPPGESLAGASPSRGLSLPVPAFASGVAEGLPPPVPEAPAPAPALALDPLTPVASAPVEASPDPRTAGSLRVALEKVPAKKADSESRALRGWTARAAQESRKASVPAGAFSGRARQLRRKGPFTAAMAEAELESADSVDELLDSVFAFAQQFFAYTAIFDVKGDLAEGRDAAGPGADRGAIAAIGVPLDLPSLLGTARSRKGAVIARLDPAGLDAGLARDLGRVGVARGAAAALPVMVRNRTIALVYGDDGDADVVLPGLGELIAVVALASGALGRLALRKKRGGARPADVPAILAASRSSRAPKPPADAGPGPKEGAAALARAFALPAGSASRSTPGPTVEGPTTGRRKDSVAAPPTASDAVARREPPPAEPARQEADLSLATDAPPAGDRAPAAADREHSLADREAAVADREAAVAGREVAAAAREVIDDEKSETLEKALSRAAESSGPRPPVGAPSSPPDAAPYGAVAMTARNPALVAPLVPGERGGDEEGPVRRTGARRGAAPVYEGRARRALEPQAALRSGSAANPWDSAGSPADRTGADEDLTVETIALVAPAEVVVESPGGEFVAAIDRSPPAAGADPGHAGQPRSDRPRGPSDRPFDAYAAPRPERPYLPSVIVDANAEYASLLRIVLERGPDSHRAFAELARAGEAVLPLLMGQFPGPLRVDRHRARDLLPAASQCGPVLELTVAIRRPALPFVTSRASVADAETRFWATHVLGEMRYPEAANALVPRLFDNDASVRRIARRSAAALVGAGAPGQPILQGLDHMTRDMDQPTSHRVLAIETIGEIRNGATVPPLVAVLLDPSDEVGDASRRALLLITRQDFGRDPRRWTEWWSRNANRHRLEWLIDALTHEQPPIRRAAGDELKQLTKEYFGYYDDLPKKERERAQALYRAWWQTEGRRRFP